MGGVTGRKVNAAWARSSTWGTPASVTRQILLLSTDGLDDNPALVTDEAFGLQFLAEADVGERDPITTELQVQGRYEDIDSWIAAACGSAANPTAISSQGAANSLVAYSHVITLANELWPFYTLAADLTQYVHEIPTFKIRGFTMRVGENGRILFNFPIVGNRATYDSTVNINSTVGGARAAAQGQRMFRQQGQFRLNVQSAGALGATDVISILKEFELSVMRPLAQDDHVVGLDYIIEPDDDGAAEFGLKLTYPRMATISAQSIALAFGAGRAMKGDLVFTGNFINSTTKRSMTFEFPDAQYWAYTAPVTGYQQARPQAELRFAKSASSPAGMAFVQPIRITIVNTNSQNLLI